MEAAITSTPAHEPAVLPAFPPWLDLPPGYTVQDWIRWEKGKLIAQRLRENPPWIELAISRLEAKGDHLFAAQAEWRHLMASRDWPRILGILEASDDEGQRLRSSMPFSGEPFVTDTDLETLHERAFTG